MFDFKNLHKQFSFKNNMAQGKMTDQYKQTNKQTLINSYKQNQILRDNADPNYRNKVKRSLIKVKSVALFDGKFPERI